MTPTRKATSEEAEGGEAKPAESDGFSDSQKSEIAQIVSDTMKGISQPTPAKGDDKPVATEGMSPAQVEEFTRRAVEDALSGIAKDADEEDHKAAHATIADSLKERAPKVVTAAQKFFFGSDG